MEDNFLFLCLKVKLETYPDKYCVYIVPSFESSTVPTADVSRAANAFRSAVHTVSHEVSSECCTEEIHGVGWADSDSSC